MLSGCIRGLGPCGLGSNPSRETSFRISSANFKTFLFFKKTKVDPVIFILRSSTWFRTLDFQSGKTGSNPVRSTKQMVLSYSGYYTGLSSRISGFDSPQDRQVLLEC